MSLSLCLELVCIVALFLDNNHIIVKLYKMFVHNHIGIKYFSLSFSVVIKKSVDTNSVTRTVCMIARAAHD